MLLGLALAIASGRAASGQLAAVGPEPLRFQKPVVLASLVLPPLAMRDPAPPLPVPQPAPAPATNAAPAPVSAPPLAVAPTNDTPVTVVPTNDTPVTVVPPTVIALVPAPDTNAPVILSPQLLLQFFQRIGTNRATSIIEPLDFRPADPPPLPSSTSTYLTPPRTP